MVIVMEWKQIILEGIEYNYEVSTTGLVRNKTTGKILKGNAKSDGYLKVALYNNGKSKLVSVHRIVAIMFIPNEEELPYVNHKDENKLNNHVDNLEWCTPQYNIKYSINNHKVSGKQCKGYRGVSDDGEVIEFYCVNDLEDAGFNYAKVMQNINGRNIHYKGYRWSKIW